MNRVDEPTLPEGPQYIADYIIALRNRGPFLPYSDYLLIEHWIERCPNLDKLLLVLDDILPNLFANNDSTKMPPSLKKVANKVEKSLNALSGLPY